VMRNEDRMSTHGPAGRGRLALAVLLWVGAATPLFAQDFLRVERNVPGDSKPVTLYADQVATWTEGGQRVILLRGTVRVEHGVLHARMPQAVVWVDQGNFRKTGVLHVQLFADGEVAVQNGSESKSGRMARIDLHTRGEVKLKAYADKVRQEPRRDDPLYRWAAGLRAPQAPPTVLQTSAQEPAGPPSVSAFPQLGPPTPQPVTPAPLPPPDPPPALTAPPAAPAGPPPSPPAPAP